MNSPKLFSIRIKIVESFDLVVVADCADDVKKYARSNSDWHDSATDNAVLERIEATEIISEVNSLDDLPDGWYADSGPWCDDDYSFSLHTVEEILAWSE